MEEHVNHVINCFEQDEVSRLLTFKELQTKLEHTLDDTQLETVLIRLVEQGRLLQISDKKGLPRTFFMTRRKSYDNNGVRVFSFRN
jgi:hypothetical protein